MTNTDDHDKPQTERVLDGFIKTMIELIQDRADALDDNNDEDTIGIGTKQIVELCQLLNETDALREKILRIEDQYVMSFELIHKKRGERS
jgi:hypothetical protein